MIKYNQLFGIFQNITSTYNLLLLENDIIIHH